jgi:hypothetical protein
VADLLHMMFPPINRTYALSRSELYYDIDSALDAFPPLLALAKRVLTERLPCPDLWSVTNGLVENLFNVLAAVTFGHWEKCCNDSVWNRKDELVYLDRLLDALERLAMNQILLLTRDRQCHERYCDIDWNFLYSIPSHPGCDARFRMFREFDNRVKILDEVSYLTDRVLPRFPAEAVWFPMYGSLSLGCYFRAFQRLRKAERLGTGPDTVFLRLGFHDLGEVAFRNEQGNLIPNRMIPAEWLPAIQERIKGRVVLVVDDNVGYGSTLRTCKELVHKWGAFPITRSAETAWHLFQRLEREHCISDAVDLPSLRSNFHHSLYELRITCLLSRTYTKYYDYVWKDQSLDSLKQMRGNYDIAASAEWHGDQMMGMLEELEYAKENWLEGGVPEYPRETISVERLSPCGPASADR